MMVFYDFLFLCLQNMRICFTNSFSANSLLGSDILIIFASRNLNVMTMIGSINVSDVYMDILGSLPNEDKIDLISRLVKSMKKAVVPTKKNKDPFASFSSDWGGEMSTEDYADMLRSENVESMRSVETW